MPNIQKKETTKTDKDTIENKKKRQTNRQRSIGSMNKVHDAD